MHNDLLRLIYFSHVWKKMTSVQLEQILAKSRENNARNKISGLLCYGGDSFIQILEGPEQSVISLYSTIIQDQRHERCKILDIHLAKKRIFESWAMGYVHSSKIDFEKLISSIKNTYLSHEQAINTTSSILRKYIGKNNIKMNPENLLNE